MLLILVINVFVNGVTFYLDLYNKLFSLHIYQMVEREGECNLFINGFQEQMKICPNDIEVKINGN